MTEKETTSICAAFAKYLDHLLKPCKNGPLHKIGHLCVAYMGISQLQIFHGIFVLICQKMSIDISLQSQNSFKNRVKKIIDTFFHNLHCRQSLALTVKTLNIIAVTVHILTCAHTLMAMEQFVHPMKPEEI